MRAFPSCAAACAHAVRAAPPPLPPRSSDDAGVSVHVTAATPAPAARRREVRACLRWRRALCGGVSRRAARQAVTPPPPAPANRPAAAAVASSLPASCGAAGRAACRRRVHACPAEACGKRPTRPILGTAAVRRVRAQLPRVGCASAASRSGEPVQHLPCPPLRSCLIPRPLPQQRPLRPHCFPPAPGALHGARGAPQQPATMRLLSVVLLAGLVAGVRAGARTGGQLVGWPLAAWQAHR